MPSHKHIEHFTADDISKYLHDELSSQEMHAFEEHMLNCALCNDAVEGFEVFSEIDIAKASNDLRSNLLVKKGSNLNYYRLGIAAAVTILLGVFIFVSVDKMTEESEIALSKVEKEGDKAQPDKFFTDTVITRQVNLKTTESQTKEETIQQQASKNANSEENTTETEVASIIPKTTITNLPEEDFDDLPAEEGDMDSNFFDDKDDADYEPVSSFDDNSGGESVVSETATDNNDLKLSEQASDPLETVVSEKSVARSNFFSKAEDQNTNGQEQMLAPPQKQDLATKSRLIQPTKSKKSKRTRNPEPVGGHKKYKDYLLLSLKHRYPEEAIKNSIEGIVKLEFKVNKDGKIEALKILDGLGHGCDEEAKRLVLKGPSWRPALENGEKIDTLTQVTVIFKLPE